MGGVSVKDVESHKFIQAYAAFLKRQGKLPMYVVSLPYTSAAESHTNMFSQSRFVSIQWMKDEA
jgi:hypothetical protein